MITTNLFAALDAHRQPIPADTEGYLLTLLPPVELLDRLRARYTSEPVPPCRVCGAELEVGSMGGGNATSYGCPKPEGVTFGDWTKHYTESRFTHLRPGDSEVIALVGIVEQLLAESLGHCERCDEDGAAPSPADRIVQGPHGPYAACARH